jgi:hypothetical protein
MSAEHITTFAEMLEEQLEAGICVPNDFVSLAITGEELRRALVVAEETYCREREALRRYDAALPTLRAFVPLGVEHDLPGAFSALVACDGRDEQDEDFVVGIDEVLGTAAASCRAGVLSHDAVVALGRQAHELARDLAPRLPWAWQLAEERSCALGPDAAFEGLYDWLEELAQLSASRLDLYLAL